MEAPLRLFVSIARSRWLGLAVALMLLVTGLIDTVEQLGEDLSARSLGVHHGALLYCLHASVRSLAEVLDAAGLLGERLDA